MSDCKNKVKKKYFNFQVHVSYFFLLAVGEGKNLENWKISSIVNFLCVTEEKKTEKGKSWKNFISKLWERRIRRNVRNSTFFFVFENRWSEKFHSIFELTHTLRSEILSDLLISRKKVYELLLFFLLFHPPTKGRLIAFSKALTRIPSIGSSTKHHRAVRTNVSIAICISSAWTRGRSKQRFQRLQKLSAAPRDDMASMAANWSTSNLWKR